MRTEEVVIVNFDFDSPAEALAFHCCVKLVQFGFGERDDDVL